MSSGVTQGKYILYPLALFVPPDKWQAMVIISCAVTEIGGTKARSKSFPSSPMIFDSEAQASEYALRYGKMLVLGNDPELPVAPGVSR